MMGQKFQRGAGGGETMTVVMPLFVFARRRDVELEAGFILAGQLVVDIPRTTKPKRRDQRMVYAIVQKLTAAASAGEMPADAIVYGWRDGRRPDNADATLSNDALMQRWADSRIVIALRVEQRNDGMLTIDSDLLRQAGLVKEH